MAMLMQYFFLVLLLALALEIQSCESVKQHNMLLNMPLNSTKLGPTMSVSITNKEPSSITVHCSSRDNDLQLHTLAPGAVYGFQFHMNFWGTTLFSCEFQYQNQHAGFPVWKGPGVDGDFMCKQCVWVVEPIGIYGGQEGQTATMFQQWN
jgi:hypothetical protein